MHQQPTQPASRSLLSHTFMPHKALTPTAACPHAHALSRCAPSIHKVDLRPFWLFCGRKYVACPGPVVKLALGALGEPAWGVQYPKAPAASAACEYQSKDPRSRGDAATDHRHTLAQHRRRHGAGQWQFGAAVSARTHATAALPHAFDSAAINRWALPGVPRGLYFSIACRAPLSNRRYMMLVGSSTDHLQAAWAGHRRK